MRTRGEETKKKILEEAERLFSEKGFDGTSVAMIARAVGINKGLIYYHFKNKDDIIVSLFLSVVDELLEHMAGTEIEPDGPDSDIDLKEKMRHELAFLEPKKKILSVMLMEAFKEKDKDNFLFKCAEIHMSHEGEYLKKIRALKMSRSTSEQEYLVYEFFTGFIPVIAFMALKDKWCRYYDCNGEELVRLFLDSFEKTHLAAHETETKR
jgi:AcrR family transcriptional regulator